MLALFYQTHLQQHLTRSQFLVLSILLNLLQSERQVKLKQLARVFPYPIAARVVYQYGVGFQNSLNGHMVGQPKNHASY
ncbi:hypothetical protein [Microcoleus sp. AR_TQ3_B6]|uniref:hypothetical protein n=1 Tax=Microcoleus sp. AR_TQ3_B6 TaxID=3055284 RepID=UPI002FD71601